MLTPEKHAPKECLSLRKRLHDHFYPVIRQRGEKYAQQGRVELLRCDRTGIKATVRGSMKYNVSISLRDETREEPELVCSCPFFRQGFLCKHLWAVILEAEKALIRMRGSENRGSGCGKAAFPPSDWRSLLSKSAFRHETPASASSSNASRFLLCYRLDIAPRGTEISALERFVKKDGSLGRKKTLQASTIEHSGLPKIDRTLIAILEEICRRQADRYRSFLNPTHRDLDGLKMEPRDIDVILPLLTRTGRCSVHHHRYGKLADPLREGDPMEAALELEAHLSRDSDGKRTLELTPMVRLGHGEKSLALSDLPVIFQTTPVYFIWRHFLYEIKGPDISWIKAIRKAAPLKVSEGEFRDLVLRLEPLKNFILARLPDEIAPKIIENEPPSPFLTVDLDEDRLKAEAHLEYVGIKTQWDEPGQTVLDPDKWLRYRRDERVEKAFMEQLVSMGFNRTDAGYERALSGASEALAVLSEQGWQILGRDRRRVRGGRPPSLSISSGIDWFDLSGDISFGDQAVSLPKAVKAYLEGRSLIPLDDGSVGVLPETWLSQNLKIFQLGSIHAEPKSGERLRFHSTHALILDSLLEDARAHQLDPGFRRFRNALNSFTGIRKIPVPKAFKGKLRPYQKETLGWFTFLKDFGFGGILADDMGLGKTVQVLAWLAIKPKDEPAGPSLVVAPTSLIFNWEDEAQRFVPDLAILTYAGPRRRALRDKIGKADLLLTTYGILRRDIGILKDCEFNYVILDESQAIKNATAQSAKAVRLLKARNRLCLTGTPLENHLGELWSQMEFLNPGLLGARSVFENNFARPAANRDETALKELKALVRPFILRRTKNQVATELPEKMEHVIRCPMPDSQARIYSRVRDHYRSEVLSSVEKQGMTKSRMKVLEGLLRLRQAANHPGLIGQEESESGKLEELMGMVRDATAAGHKALIFSQFTKMLGLIRESVINAGIPHEYLDGRIPQAKRESRIRRFQADDRVKLFLISLRAGGLGLNLTAADYVFLVDPWWNPAVEAQAIDRTHRIGQKKKVFTYRLITADTVEEKVLALQEKKRELASAILSGSRDLLGKLSRKDLEILFS